MSYFLLFFFFSPPSHIAANCSIGHLPTFRQQLHKNSFFSWNLGPLLMCDLQRRLPINVVELFTVTSARGCQQPSLRRCRSVCAPLPLVIKTFPWGGVSEGLAVGEGWGQAALSRCVHLQSRCRAVPEPSCPELSLAGPWLQRASKSLKDQAQQNTRNTLSFHCHYVVLRMCRIWSKKQTHTKKKQQSSKTPLTFFLIQ